MHFRVGFFIFSRALAYGFFRLFEGCLGGVKIRHDGVKHDGSVIAQFGYIHRPARRLN